MSVLLAILAALGVLILLVLTLRSLIKFAGVVPRRADRWVGHVRVDFFNHPPQAWAAP